MLLESNNLIKLCLLDADSQEDDQLFKQTDQLAKEGVRLKEHHLRDGDAEDLVKLKPRNPKAIMDFKKFSAKQSSNVDRSWPTNRCNRPSRPI